MTKLRYWLIKKLAGRDIIVINAKIEGGIKQKFGGQSGYVANDEIIYSQKDAQHDRFSVMALTREAKLSSERELLSDFPVVLKEREDVIRKHKQGA